MKLTIVLIMTAVLAVGARAQKSRVETSVPDTSAEDSRPNSDLVPDGIAVNGSFEKVTVLRFKYDTDLLLGLEEMVKSEGIGNAVILAGIGSVRSYHYHVVGSRKFPVKNVFVEDSTGSADIACMNGYVIGGRVHAHITFANAECAFGGHLETGTRVYTFAIVTLGLLGEGVDLRRIDDLTFR